MSENPIVYPLSMGAKPESIGNLSDLTTINKTNVVSAVNEVNGKFPVSIANGGTGATTNINAFTNLGMIDTQGQDFPANSEADYISAVQNFFETNSTEYVPYIFNAGWQGQGYGAALGVQTEVTEKNKTLAVFNQKIGFRLYHKDGNNAWQDYSPNGTTLYWNQSGSYNTITLSEDVSNFQRLRIYYKDVDGYKETKDVHQPLSGVKIGLATNKIANNAAYMLGQEIIITGTSLTFPASTGGYIKLTSSGNTFSLYSDRISVVKVVGYKY